MYYYVVYVLKYLCIRLNIINIELETLEGDLHKPQEFNNVKIEMLRRENKGH